MEGKKVKAKGAAEKGKREKKKLIGEGRYLALALLGLVLGVLS